MYQQEIFLSQFAEINSQLKFELQSEKQKRADLYYQFMELKNKFEALEEGKKDKQITLQNEMHKIDKVGYSNCNFG